MCVRKNSSTYQSKKLCYRPNLELITQYAAHFERCKLASYRATNNRSTRSILFACVGLRDQQILEDCIFHKNLHSVHRNVHQDKKAACFSVRRPYSLGECDMIGVFYSLQLMCCLVRRGPNKHQRRLETQIKL